MKWQTCGARWDVLRGSQHARSSQERPPSIRWSQTVEVDLDDLDPLPLELMSSAALHLFVSRGHLWVCKLNCCVCDEYVYMRFCRQWEVVSARDMCVCVMNVFICNSIGRIYIYVCVPDVCVYVTVFAVCVCLCMWCCLRYVFLYVWLCLRYAWLWCLRACVWG